jgi:hypothetical protein
MHSFHMYVKWKRKSPRIKQAGKGRKGNMPDWAGAEFRVTSGNPPTDGIPFSPRATACSR